MNRYSPILASETVTVALFDHPAGLVHHDSEEEIADDYSISFVEQRKRATSPGRATEVFVRKNGRWTNPGWHLDSGK